MGCDIHLHIEAKVNERWEHYAAPHVNRWYQLFAWMAGVRGEPSEAIVVPRGAPQDASILTQILRKDYGSDGHSDSWLDHNEIMELEDRIEKWCEQEQRTKLDYDLEHNILHTYLAGNSFTSKWRYPGSALPEGITDIRFVFWFDN